MKPPQSVKIFHDIPIEKIQPQMGSMGQPALEAAEAKLITLVERIRGAATAKARWVHPPGRRGYFLRMAQ